MNFQWAVIAGCHLKFCYTLYNDNKDCSILLLFRELMHIHLCTWLMEEADHSKTYHCSMGSVVPLVFCSLCPTLLTAGTSVSVAEQHMSKI